MKEKYKMEIANALKLARRAKDDNDSEGASKYYELVLLEDPDNWEANFYSAYFKAVRTAIKDIDSNAIMLSKKISTCFKLMKESVSDKKELKLSARQTFDDVLNLAKMYKKAVLDFRYKHSDIRGTISYREETTNLFIALGDVVSQTFFEDPEIACFAAETWLEAFFDIKEDKFIFFNRQEEALEILRNKLSVYTNIYEKEKEYDDAVKEAEEREEADRKAAKEREEAERRAEIEKRNAEIERRKAEREAKEKAEKAKEKRREAERKAELKRIEEKRKAEEERKEAERKAEEERKEAERKAEEERRQAELERIKTEVLYKVEGEYAVVTKQRKEIETAIISPSVEIGGKTYPVLKIEKVAFSDTGVKTVEIPKGLRLIGGEAFYSCKKLEKINIPSTVQTIGKFAFAYCSSLKNIKLPEGIKKIGDGAFYGAGLVDIKIPKNAQIGTDIVKYTKIGNDREYKNLCLYCGGQIKGFFTKKCAVCGREALKKKY